MGRGDKRSRKGKIFKGSYGNSRLQRAKKAVVAAPAIADETTQPAAALGSAPSAAAASSAAQVPSRKLSRRMESGATAGAA